MKDNSRPSSFSEEAAHRIGQNIWSTNQPRPSSLDNIWAAPQNIWTQRAGVAGNLPISSPPDFLTQGSFVPGSGHRGSFGGNQMGFSPSGSPLVSAEMNPFEVPGLSNYEMHLRRHSYGDVYNYSAAGPQMAGNNSGLGSQMIQGQTQMQAKPSGKNDDMSGTIELVNEYFESDPHERVKVTLELLTERFFDEERYLSDAYQLPKFPVENSLRNYQLVLVAFKAGRIDVFYMPQKSSVGAELTGLKVGDLVIVEADRGRDLGKILKLNISIDEARLLKLLQFQEQQSALGDNLGNDISVKNMSDQSPSGGSANPPTLHFPKSILSLAQSNEVIQILNKKQDEEKACRLCLAKIANSTGVMGSNSEINMNQSDLLQMKLIDAEYQFDRKKLIFYYSTSKRIDFRDLVRELFRIYKTRIWMCAVVGLPYVASQSSGQQGYASNVSASKNGKFTKSPVAQPNNTTNNGKTNINNNGNNNNMFQLSLQMPPMQHSQQQQQQQQHQQMMMSNQHMNPQYGNQMMNVRLQEPTSQGFDGFKKMTYSQAAFQPNSQIAYNMTLENDGFPTLDSAHQTPRRLVDPANGDKKEDSTVRNTESFVLKSLVDSINH